MDTQTTFLTEKVKICHRRSPLLKVDFHTGSLSQPISRNRNQDPLLSSHRRDFKDISYSHYGHSRRHWIRRSQTHRSNDQDRDEGTPVSRSDQVRSLVPYLGDGDTNERTRVQRFDQTCASQCPYYGWKFQTLFCRITTRSHGFTFIYSLLYLKGTFI